MIEVSLKLGKTPREEITDGEVLEQVLGDMSFGNVKLDKYVYTVTSKDGLLGGQTYNQPHVLRERTIDSMSITNADAVLVDISVTKYLDGQGKTRTEAVKRTRDADETILEIQPDPKTVASIPTHIKNELEDIELTADVQEAVTRMMSLMDQQLKTVKDECNLEKNSMQRRTQEKEDQLDVLKNECENQLEATRQEQERVKLSEAECLRETNQLRRKLDKQNTEYEENYNKWDNWRRNAHQERETNLAFQAKLMKKLDFVADNLHDAGQIPKFQTIDIWDGPQGFTTSRAKSESLWDAIMNDAPDNERQYVHPDAIGPDKVPLGSIQADKAEPENILGPNPYQEWLDQNSDDEEDVQMDQSKPVIPSKRHVSAVMEISKVPNLSKLGIERWDETTTTLAEHLGNLRTSFKFQLHGLSEEMKVAIVLRSMPSSYGWLHTYFNETTLTTADSLMKKIAEILIGSEGDFADILLKIHKKDNEDVLHFHSRLSNITNYISGGDRGLAFEIVRKKIEESLPSSMRIEYRKKLNELKPAQKHLKAIGEALVLLRKQFGNEKLATRPAKEYLQVAALQRDRNRHGKDSFDKKNIVCWHCDKKGHMKSECKSYAREQKQSGRKTQKWKKRK